jgi:hypothetical protein
MPVIKFQQVDDFNSITGGAAGRQVVNGAIHFTGSNSNQLMSALNSKYIASDACVMPSRIRVPDGNHLQPAVCLIE